MCTHGCTATNKLGMFAFFIRLRSFFSPVSPTSFLPFRPISAEKIGRQLLVCFRTCIFAKNAHAQILKIKNAFACAPDDSARICVAMYLLSWQTDKVLPSGRKKKRALVARFFWGGESDIAFGYISVDFLTIRSPSNIFVLGPL